MVIFLVLIDGKFVQPAMTTIGYCKENRKLGVIQENG